MQTKRNIFWLFAIRKNLYYPNALQPQHPLICQGLCTTEPLLYATTMYVSCIFKGSRQSNFKCKTTINRLLGFSTRNVRMTPILSPTSNAVLLHRLFRLIILYITIIANF